jgi:hypothetical protein
MDSTPKRLPGAPVPGKTPQIDPQPSELLRLRGGRESPWFTARQARSGHALGAMQA